MLKHIIFDFDGTLADSTEIALQIVNILAEKYKFRKIDMAEFRELSKLPVNEKFKRVGVPMYKIPQMTVDCLVNYKQLMASMVIFDGMVELMKALKNIGLCISIISSNSVDNIKEFIERNELNIFDNIISSNNLFGKHKSLQNYLKKNNLKAEEVLYIGDELRDIEACKKAMVKIISATWGFDSPELLTKGNPDYVAYKPEDILEIVEGVQGDFVTA